MLFKINISYSFFECIAHYAAKAILEDQQLYQLLVEKNVYFLLQISKKNCLIINQLWLASSINNQGDQNTLENFNTDFGFVSLSWKFLKYIFRTWICRMISALVFQQWEEWFWLTDVIFLRRALPCLLRRAQRKVSVMALIHL